MGYRVLADGVAGLHYAYLAYLLAGGFIAWRWPRTIAAHIVAAIWAVLIIATPVPCPLTAAQNALRELGGQPPLPDSFINIYIRGTFYPASHETDVRVMVAGIVAVSWIGLALRQVRRAQRERQNRDVREPVKHA
jgi:hypothetical protein